ncbi:MAG TPA: hypothetical protein VL401_01295, partial [Alphaproteobacteria bacterium]|nr:hypothetical protein [Alphaproteobacteria bacterium]
TIFISLFLILLISGFIGLKFVVQFLDNATSSSNLSPDDKSFFTSMGGLDYRRIALIKPYQATSIDKNTWSIELFTNSVRYQTSINNIEDIAVINQKYIVTHSPNTLYAGNRVKELWFVITPETKIEKGFVDQDELQKYLKSENIPTPEFVKVNDLYSKLVKQGYLEWFPEKYKESK